MCERSWREREASFERRCVIAKGTGVNVNQRGEGGYVHVRVGSARTLKGVGLYSFKRNKGTRNAHCARHESKRSQLDADQRFKVFPLQRYSICVIFEFLGWDARHLPPCNYVARLVQCLRQARTSVVTRIRCQCWSKEKGKQAASTAGVYWCCRSSSAMYHPSLRLIHHLLHVPSLYHAMNDACHI